MSTASAEALEQTAVRPGADPETEPPLFPPEVAARIGLIAAAFVALHWDILRRLVHFAATDGDWSHAFLIPAFSGYFIYQQRDRLRETPARACWWGLPVMLAALAGYGWGIAAGNDMLKGYSMIVQIAGVVLLLAGPAVMRVLWLPIAYLAFAVKISPAWWAAATWQMQLLAAKAAVAVLGVVGLDAELSGTAIRLYDGLEVIGTLTVAEACSGMRMLITFLALGVAVAYLWDRPWWARLTMTAAAVPIAMAVNILRVVVLSLLYLIDPAYSSGDFHTMIGMLMLIPGLGLFLGVGWALRLLEGDGEEEAVAAGDHH